ncbi:SNF2-related protein [Methylococcus mesophilus]|uniref:SNF2-related protein n=1 Tax=Methylococcus mesophilus TaxID=2993564 RepID=UPI00224B6FC4|nr:SNF2-related protein [Methylococcus mesophilus]UZR28135.1 SNF2-related protein [Methylococcus mesophilus]
MVFRLFKKAQATADISWHRRLSDQGVHVGRTGSGAHLHSELLSGYLAQLVDDGLADQLAEDEVLIPWPAVYEAMRSPGYDELPAVLELPPFTDSEVTLQSRNSLIDHDFSIAVAAWRSDKFRNQPDVIGAMLLRDERMELMRPEQWELFSEVRDFARRRQEQRDERLHRQAWGRIRTLALKAGARLDDFLHRSVVLTPERLDIALRKSAQIADDNVIEIEPTFAGAPPDWLERFDRSREVLDRYDIVTPEGIVQVLITPQVKTVLQEVKRLPLRRVAGSRAQAFILNPYAALGPDAQEVIDEGQFESARESAGLQYERFAPMIERDGTGYPLRVGLLIESASATGPATSETEWLTDEDLGKFVTRLEGSLAKGFQLLGWNGYDLELQGETPAHLAELRGVLEQRRKPAAMVSYAQVHDLSAYSTRIEGIDVEKPYYSPYITKKKDDEGWFPENVLPLIAYTPEGDTELVAVPATKDALDKLREAVGKAEAAGKDAVEVPWLPKPMPIEDAKDIAGIFDEVLDEVKRKNFDPERKVVERKEKLGARKTLILRANIQAVDYEEQRREALLALPAEPDLPRCLNPNFNLLPHQQQGLAWLQHLHRSRAEYHVRGAVLADDMGLGKTYQLLTFMGWLAENDRGVAPMLVVAPVSLLENWKDEAGKFIRPGTLPILTAYGESLAPLRVPREAIDERLRTEDGLVRFLKPGWVGGAKVVLTTYETLRDLEFSFAAERWSVMVCDEAQRIKNPAAMVTRAAKKQNVGFKVACTGTPVENTLADLWCLFDFVQPGLLGALNDFGQRYRKPIEARDDEERARVEELRTRISPQILRRTKAEVAKDLPQKVIVDDCRRLRLSTTQRNLYAKAIEDFKKRNDPSASVPFKNHLGLLQYLRLVCTDPRRHGLAASKPEPLSDYRAKAPKLDWLLGQLERIRTKDEKAIIFCEFRNIQRLLQHYIEQTFKVRADIINGETSAATSHAASRQKRIKAFQEKPGFGVIILSPVAVGFGVNIQAANHVIHYTRTWNPAKEDQATDRAYRIGQEKDVFVYYPVVTADDFSTFDVKLDQLLTKKRRLASDMLNGSGDLAPGDFDIVDVVPGGDAAELQERIDLDLVLRMEWRHFEGLAAALWSKQGFDVCYCTPGTNDQGVDVVAISDGHGVLIQTKTSSNEGAKFGWEAIKDLVGGEAFYQRKHPNVQFKKVGMTNQFFSAQALEQAELNGVMLVDQNRLGELLTQFPVTMLELERLLYSEWGSE